MRKQYFGKDRENGYDRIYVVKLLTDEIDRFATYMKDYGFDNYWDIPEIMDCKNDEYAIAFHIDDNEEKEWFEQGYRDYKEIYHGKTKEV